MKIHYLPEIVELNWRWFAEIEGLIQESTELVAWLLMNCFEEGGIGCCQGIYHMVVDGISVAH